MKNYDVDLAYVHDAGYVDLAKNAGQMIAHMIYKKIGRKGLVVDLGCGSGVLAKELLQNGYEVFGVDQSKAFIDLAKKNAPQASFMVNSLFDVDIPRCIGIVSTGECLNYLFDNKNNLYALEELFVKIFSALECGGVFIFDMIEPKVSGDQSKIVEGRDWTLFVHNYEDPKTEILIRDITLFRKVGDELYRKSHESHRVQLYRHLQIAALLKKIGFHTSLIHAYGNVAFRNHHYGFICTKKAV